WAWRRRPGWPLDGAHGRRDAKPLLDCACLHARDPGVVERWQERLRPRARDPIWTRSQGLAAASQPPGAVGGADVLHGCGRRAAVAVGDLLLVRPGAKVPVDAEVIEGESEIDESTVTGESLPVHKEGGDSLIGATINKNGTLRARATAIGSDTALAQIVNLVQ